MPFENMTSRADLSRITGAAFRLTFYFFCIIVAFGLSISGAQAQVGIGFENGGAYQGTIGFNKGSVEAYTCPSGTVLRGLYHVDKSMTAGYAGTQGMTSQVGLYCGRLDADASGNITVEPLTPNGNPTVLGAAYNSPGTTRHGYCASSSVVARLGGYDRQTANVPWSSSLEMSCRPALKGLNDWVEFSESGANPVLVGVNEDNAEHFRRGPFCGATSADARYTAVTGIHRQAGGQGYDGINVYCGSVVQARHSAYLEFKNYAWSKTLGGQGWRVSLEKDGAALPGLGNMTPWSSLAANNKSTFTAGTESYVRPGSKYGAKISAQPSGADEAAYLVEGNCKDGIGLSNLEDDSCGITVTGLPDIAVEIVTPENPYERHNQSQLVNFRAVNMGPAAVSPSWGYAIEVTIPAGWQINDPMPSGCAISGSKLTCQINQTLVGSGSNGAEGGEIRYSLNFTTNPSVNKGSYPVPITLLRSIPDASSDPARKDYNKDNDSDSDFITYLPEPNLTVVKITKGGVGSFDFKFLGKGDAAVTERITTTSPNTRAMGKSHGLEPGKSVVVTEVPTSGIWEMESVSCLIADTSASFEPTQVDLAGKKFTIPGSYVTDENDIVCTVTNQKQTVNTSKKSNYSNQGGVLNGDIITYTLTTVITGIATKSDIVLTDTLSAGLVYQGITSQTAGSNYTDSKSGQTVTFTLPAGAKPGTHSVSYSALVNASSASIVEVKNTVVSDTGSCGDCSTTNPVVTVVTTKTSNWPDGAGVQAGDFISYTLTTEIKGGPSGRDIVLTDTMSDGLTFDIVSDAGPYRVDVSAAPKLKFTLPAGTPAGTHSVTYQAIVDSDVITSVKNQVVPDKGTCQDCTITNPIVSIKTDKTAQVSGGWDALLLDNTITFTLSVEVKYGNTTHDLVLTDTLDAALGYQGVSANPGGFVESRPSGRPDQVLFTLPAGKGPGIHTVSYTAKLLRDDVEFVRNQVIPSDGACGSCGTETDVIGIFTSKTANRIDGSFVQRGDEITYFITVDVQGSTGTTTSKAVVVTDELSEGLTFIDGSVKTFKGTAFEFSKQSAKKLQFTLPIGTSAGQHIVEYAARVDKEGAFSSVNNGIQASDSHCVDCSVNNAVIQAETTKTNGLNNGQAVHPGQIITYELTTVVSSSSNQAGATTRDIKLTDTIGSGLRYVPNSASGDFVVDESASPTLEFTLRAGTPVGTYTVTYQAEVLENASASVKNTVSSNYGSCNDCVLENPITRVSTKKSASPDKTVRPGEEITYTLTVSVKGAPTGDPVVLTDTLSPGLTYVSGSASGTDFTVDASRLPVLTFTLDKGAAVGEHTVTYRAKVDDDATGEVNNSVVSSLGTCTDCTVTQPVSGVWVSKTATPGVGTSVRAGDVITYSLLVDVDGADSPSDVELTDTLGPGLTYVVGSAKTTQGGPFTINVANAPVLQFTLPAGAKAGSENVVTYQAEVTEQAITSVLNSVQAKGGSCVNCDVVNPVSSISTKKKNNLAPGVSVMEGQEITYTLEVTVSGTATAKDLLLVDTLGDGLEFVPGSVSGAGFTSNVAGASRLEFTLLAGAGVGVHPVSYKARVLKDAIGTITNEVKPEVGSCDDCTVVNPVSSVVVKKSSDKASGESVRPEDVIQYSLAVTVAGATTREPVVLTDTLGDGLSYVPGSAKGSAFTVDATAAPVLVFTLPAGAAVGEHVVTYEAVVTDLVDENGMLEVSNSVSSNLGKCDDCTTVVPVNPAEYEIEVVKLAELQFIRRGEHAPFTISATNHSIYPARGVQIVDVIPVGFRYVKGTSTVDGVAREPMVRGRTLTFDNIDIPPSGRTLIRLRLLALSTIGPGKYTNVAFVNDRNGDRISNEGRADIEILAEPVFDCGDVVGTVYDDLNRNGYRDEGEPGLPGVRVVTVNGQLITTDRYGRWHVPCAALPDQRIGSNFIAKVDDRTLPTGYRLTSENPRVVRLTAGKMTSVEFGAAISRVVRLDLQDSAFEPDEIALKPEWMKQIDQLIATLKPEISILRLSYHASERDAELAQERIRHLRGQIMDLWRREGEFYRLDIESSIEVAK